MRLETTTGEIVTAEPVRMIERQDDEFFAEFDGNTYNLTPDEYNRQRDRLMGREPTTDHTEVERLRHFIREIGCRVVSNGDTQSRLNRIHDLVADEITSWYAGLESISKIAKEVSHESE